MLKAPIMRWWSLSSCVVFLACAAPAPERSVALDESPQSGAGASSGGPTYTWRERFPWPDVYSNDIVYDAPRERVLMWDAHHDSFTGRFETACWEWKGDDSTWRKRPESAEELRNDDGYFSAGSAHAYDSTRGVLVLTDSLNGFWEWDGADGSWTLRGEPQSVVHTAFGMIYDAERELFVIVGTERTDDHSMHVYEWDPSDASFSEREASGTLPGERTSGVVGWDPVRRKVALFGGYFSAESRSRSDLWEWDPETGQWEERPPTGEAPPPRADAAIAFNEKLGHLFVFGGRDPEHDNANPDAPLNDLWEWDGDAGEWTQHALAEDSAVPRGGADYTLVYDPVRELMTLLGGEHNVTDTGRIGQDLMDWNDATGAWVDRRPPAGRAELAFAYDPVSSHVILFGGVTSSATLEDLWEWDGAAETWNPLFLPEPRPTAYARTGFIADEQQGTMLLIGATSSSTEVATWELDTEAGTWIDRSQAGGPHAPNATVVYDANRSKILAFGGDAGTTSLNDLWEWDGAMGAWALREITDPKPSPRSHALGAFDGARNRFVLFGGYGDEQQAYLDDTWEWNPEDGSWSERLARGTFDPAILPVAAYYDETRERVVMFGGERGTSSALDTVWEWDGEVGNWASIAVASEPLPDFRSGPGVAFDRGRGTAVMFSGVNSGDRRDIWELEVSCPEAPEPCVATAPEPPPPGGSGGMGTAGGSGRGGASSGGANGGGSAGAAQSGGSSGSGAIGGGGGRGGAQSGAGSSNSSGGRPDEGSGGSKPSRSEESSGCGCRLSARSRSGDWLFAAALASVWFLRRRSRR